MFPPSSILLQLLLLVQLMNQDIQLEASECPFRCVCSGQTIRCQSAGFRTLPKIPKMLSMEQHGGIVQFLTITGNTITSLHNDSFMELTYLMRLELNSNKIAFIGSEAFNGLINLKSLTLRTNLLTQLPAHVFTPIYKLEELDLSRNKLKTVPFSLEGLIYLKRLVLYGNPLHCPCSLVDLALNLKFIEPKSLAVTCHSPSEVRNRRLADLGEQLRNLAKNQTKLLGYQAISESDRHVISQNEELEFLIIQSISRWPWPQCRNKDFGGQSYSTSTENLISSYSPLINQPLNIVNPLKPIKAVPGEKARFICRIPEEQVGQIRWVLPLSATNFIKFYRRRQILEIHEVHDYHQGVYTCIASNSRQTVSSESTLEVINPIKPTITMAPPVEENEVYINSTITLRCSAEGLPPPKISWLWQKDTLPLKLVTGGRYILSNHYFTQSQTNTNEVNNEQSAEEIDSMIYSKDYEILAENSLIETTSILTIMNVTLDDANGRYICYVSNRMGSLRVSSVIRVMENQPTFSMKETQSHSNANMETKQSEFKNDNDNNSNNNNNELVKQIIEKARIRIETAVKKTAERLRDPNKRKSSIEVASLFRQPNEAALELAKAAEVYEAAIDEVTAVLRKRNELNITNHPIEDSDQTELDPNRRDALGTQLSADQLAIIAQLSGCQESVQADPCSKQLCFHLKYRSIDGTCNNLNKPKWGAALSPFLRLLPPKYENGINTPIGWSPTKLYFGYPKPSARIVSRELLGNASLMKLHVDK